MSEGKYPNPREEDIMAGDRRISRPDTLLPDWEIPDAAYRPLPIVWFTGALFVQAFSLAVLAVALSAQSGWVVLAFCALSTGAVGIWTWDRGIKTASRGWRIATITVLLVQLGFVVLGAWDRF